MNNTMRSNRLHNTGRNRFIKPSKIITQFIKQFSSGEPIQCLADKGLPEKVINTFCWVKTTFTAQSINKIYPGAASSSDNFGDQIYHSYYQWVPFMLFFHVSVHY